MTRDPDSGKGKALSADGRAAAATAAIRRDIDIALEAERPHVEVPRARTPADQELADAIEKLREQSPDWQVATLCERMASAVSARLDELDAALVDVDARLVAVTGRVEAHAEPVARLTAIRALVDGAVRRGKRWIVGSAFTALSAVFAVIYGAGIKRGVAGASEEAAKRMAADVAYHDAVITQWLPQLFFVEDSRLGAHDRALGIDTRQPFGPPPQPQTGDPAP